MVTFNAAKIRGIDNLIAFMVQLQHKHVFSVGVWVRFRAFSHSAECARCDRQVINAYSSGDVHIASGVYTNVGLPPLEPKETRIIKDGINDELSIAVVRPELQADSVFAFEHVARGSFNPRPVNLLVGKRPPLTDLARWRIND